MILRVLAGSILALGIGLWTENALAAQTFVCENGELLQVEQADMERMKRVNACVASHFGLAFQPVPLPVKRPKHLVKKVNAPTPKTPKVAGWVVRQTAKTVSKVVAAKSVAADSNTDYRRVRIINARPNGRQFFVHRK